MWHVWSRYFCSPPPNAKTHIGIGRDGCKIATMTSLPIDMADARRDSRQHGTKLVWAAAPSVVRRHGRGGSDYLDDCTPPSPHPFPGLFLGWSPRCWSARRLGGRWEMKGRIDQGLVFASPRLPLSIVARRLGPLIERLNIDPPRITWWRKCTNPPMDTNWYWLFAGLFSILACGRGSVEMDYYGAIIVSFKAFQSLNFFFLCTSVAPADHLPGSRERLRYTNYGCSNSSYLPFSLCKH